MPGFLRWKALDLLDTRSFVISGKFLRTAAKGSFVSKDNSKTPKVAEMAGVPGSIFSHTHDMM